MFGLKKFRKEPVPGGVSFYCASCGKTAAIVATKRAGELVDMGPPLGQQKQFADGLVVDLFLGTMQYSLDSTTLDAVRAVLDQPHPDPADLRRIRHEFAPFYCPDCHRSYCINHWTTQTLYDDGFYDRTMGLCPNRHLHELDD